MRSNRTLMTDFHQCLAAEIRFDPDPMVPLASPVESDNLAQRNLVVLESDNPGDRWTRSVEHSFEIDLTRPAPEPATELTMGDHDHEATQLPDRTRLSPHRDLRPGRG